MLLPRAIRPLLAVFLLLPCVTALRAQDGAAALDTDGDGLSDRLEQQLLEQFAPRFYIGEHDCASQPARFLPDHLIPTVKAMDGTVYGQASVAAGSTPQRPLVELHYFHLWGVDCGAHGHPLDTEHVAALVEGSGADLASATWTARFWYAAAHENTVCDVSQIARAATLHAEQHGAEVWISPGKHASYLNETLCRRGCGADRCEVMMPLAMTHLINLGEPHHPMNGSSFIASPRWPLLAKMSETNFGAVPVARVRALPAADIAWYSPGRHPAQGIIAHSYTTERALANSGDNTSAAISLAGEKTDTALGSANSNTDRALDSGYRHTRHALGSSLHHVGKALGLAPKVQQNEENETGPKQP